MDPNQFQQDPNQLQEEIVPTQEEQPIPYNNQNIVSDGTPYFMGDHALIRFSNGEEGFGPETFWLVDKKDHTIRPFESEMALDAAFGEDLQEALKNAITISQPIIDSSGDITDGVLKGFSILGPEYAIGEDGTAKPNEFSSYQLKERYGKSVDEDAEDKAIDSLDAFLNKLTNYEKETGVPSSFVIKLKNNQKLMAYYVSALAYGGYQLQDIYSDIVERFKESK